MKSKEIKANSPKEKVQAKKTSYKSKVSSISKSRKAVTQKRGVEFLGKLVNKFQSRRVFQVLEISLKKEKTPKRRKRIVKRHPSHRECDEHQEVCSEHDRYVNLKDDYEKLQRENKNLEAVLKENNSITKRLLTDNLEIIQRINQAKRNSLPSKINPLVIFFSLIGKADFSKFPLIKHLCNRFSISDLNPLIKYGNLKEFTMSIPLIADEMERNQVLSEEFFKEFASLLNDEREGGVFEEWYEMSEEMREENSSTRSGYSTDKKVRSLFELREEAEKAKEEIIKFKSKSEN